MATAPDYQFYSGQGGVLGEAQFYAELPRALSFVEALIYPNLVTTDKLDSFHKAVCAVVDYEVEPAVLSERLGNASVTYSEAATRYEVAEVHLIGTGLLFKGL